MTLKQFLKPDWRKIVLTIILMILPFIFINATSTIIHSCPVGTENCTPIFDWESFSIMFIISLIVIYLISCLIVCIYNKVKKK